MAEDRIAVCTSRCSRRFLVLQLEQDDRGICPHRVDGGLLSRLAADEAGGNAPGTLVNVSVGTDRRKPLRNLGTCQSSDSDAELRDVASAPARSLAAGPSQAYAGMKDNLGHDLTADLLNSMDQEAAYRVRFA